MKLLKIKLTIILLILIGVSMIQVPSSLCEELKIGRIGALAMTMDPNIVQHYGATMPIKGVIFEGLLKYNPDTMAVEACLAKSWDISKDGKELTFYLRKGIQFHEGYGELTAEDVKASIDRFFEEKKWGLLDKVKWIPPLNRIEVVDKYTIKFYLDRPNYTLVSSTFPMYMGWVTSKKALEDFGVKGVKTKAVGTGPYVLEEWVPMQRVVIKRFEKYWGEKPYYDKVRFLSFGTYQASGMALKAGEVDITPVTAEDLEIYKKDKNLETKLLQLPGYCWIGFNVRKKPVDDVRVRKAIRMAVDVDQILLAKRGDAFGDPRKLKARAMLAPTSISGYWKEAPEYKPDIEKAKALLADAGYSNGFTITMAAPLYRGGEPEVGAVVQSQLKKLGIKVKIPVIEHAAFWDEHLPGEGKFPMFVDTWAMGPLPEANLTWFTCDQRGAWNMMQYCNPKFDELLHQAAEEPDPIKRNQFYIDMQKLMDEDAIAIWIEHPVEAKAWRRNIDAKFNTAGWEQVHLTKPK
jgi:peptide/nickel transport system substrate-binding protein